MRNLLTAGLIVFVALPVAFRLGYEFVPNVHAGDGRLTDEFVFNSYLIFWGFLLTSATLGPLVAQFLQWRDDKAWAAARINARDRLAQVLRNALSDYLVFLRTTEADDRDLAAPIFLERTLQELDGFFDIYEGEQTTFNPEMHGAASNIRSHLQPLRRSLRTTHELAQRTRTCGIYLGPEALRKLRSLFDIQTISPGFALAQDPYFVRHGRVFLSAEVDWAIGSGSLPIHRFVPIDVQFIKQQWRRFLVGVPRARRGSRTPTEISPSTKILRPGYTRSTSTRT